AVFIWDVAEDRLEQPAALVDEDHLVPFAVAEEVLRALARTAERDLDVRVPHQQPAARDLVALRIDVVGVEEAVRVCVRNPLVAVDLVEVAELHYTAGRLEVVQDRLLSDEALHAHHFLGEKAPIVPKLDVPLTRDVAESLVERHRRNSSGGSAHGEDALHPAPGVRAQRAG